MSIHDGHRKRLKERFRKHGLDGFTDIQALELALFYALPRGDTNDIAHALLERFGSMSQVLEASVEDLMAIKGISEHTALYFTMLLQITRYYMVDKGKREVKLPTLEKCGRYLVPYFYGRTVETVFLLCLDAKCKVLCCREVTKGGVNSASVSVRDIVELALFAKATSVVLAHNHPSGLALPSPEDIQTTHRIAMALNAVDVHLADHVIVADGDYVSLAQSGYMQNMELPE